MQKANHLESFSSKNHPTYLMTHISAIFLMMGVLFCFSVVNADYSNVIKLNEYRAMQELMSLTGTYLSTDSMGDQELSSFSVENGKELKRQYIKGSRHYFFDSIPFTGSLSKESIIESGNLSGYVVISKRVTVKRGEISSEETVEGRRGKSVTTETYKLVGSTLTRTIVRKIFKRKFFVVGSWVIDTTSTYARNNSIDSLKMIFRKVLPVAVAGPDLSELAARMNLSMDRPETFLISKPTTADRLVADIEDGTLELIPWSEEAARERAQRGQVVSFSERQERRRHQQLMNCINLF